MTDPEDQKIRETAWRRQLTTAEEAELDTFLAAHPGNREDWELEMELNRILEHLPEAPPVASNFTALVMQAVEREQHRKAPRRRWPQWLTAWRWLPRAAAAMIVVGLTCAAYQQHQAHTRKVLAGDVAEITEIMSASDPAVMENFEPIRRLGDSQPTADAELIALMK